MNIRQQSLSKKYFLYRVFTNSFFMGAVWLYFYRLFISDQQVGVLDSLAFAIGLLAEVPSGALADKFGRDKIVRLGTILAGCGLLIQGFGNSFLDFFTGQAILMIGFSLLSGADEALFFQNLGFKKTSTDWRALVMKGSQIALIWVFFVRIAGGFLHGINPQLPWILTSLSFFLAAAIIWPIKDNRKLVPRKNLTGEVIDYFHDIKTGFKYFLQPELALYLPVIITVQGLFYTTGYGLLRLVLLDRFTFSPFLGSVVISVISLITFVILHFINKNSEAFGERKMLTSIGVAAAISLLAAIASIGYWGFGVLLILQAGEYILHPYISEILNFHAPEEQRTTILSVAAFFKTLPYVLLAPIIGYLNTINKLEYFLFSWAILIILSIVIYLKAKGGNLKISLGQLR